MWYVSSRSGEDNGYCTLLVTYISETSNSVLASTQENGITMNVQGDVFAAEAS